MKQREKPSKIWEQFSKDSRILTFKDFTTELGRRQVDTEDKSVS